MERLTSDINRIVSDSEVKQILVKSLVFENDNSKYKRVIRTLKARLTMIDEWISEI